MVVALVACHGNDELEKKVTKLEEEIQALRKERQFLEVKHVQLLKEVTELEQKVDELTKKAAPPSFAARPSNRLQPKPDKTYSLAIDPMDSIDGSADALVTIVEGYEYACPFCERARATMDELKKRYGKDVRWVGKQLVVHPQIATPAALAICAANLQHRFAAMDHLLWEDGFKARQFDNSGCESDADGCPKMVKFARKLHLDVDRFRTDMKGSCTSWLSGNRRAFEHLGANATPTFFINGRFMSGAQPADTFATLIDEELARAKSRVQSGTKPAEYYDKWVVDAGDKDLTP